MIRSAMLARVRERFGDAAGTYADAEVNSYLNEAYREMVTAEDWPFLESRATALVVNANTATVSLPLDVWRVLSVWNDTDDQLMRPLVGRGAAPRRMFLDNTEGGVPVYYRMIGTLLEVYPRPTVNTTLLVDHFAPVVDLAADGSEPIFPEPYHQGVIEGALARAYLDDGAIAQHDKHRETMTGILAAMRRDLMGVRAEGYPILVDTFWEG